jgi:hypothetical protein
MRFNIRRAHNASEYVHGFLQMEYGPQKLKLKRAQYGPYDIHVFAMKALSALYRSTNNCVPETAAFAKYSKCSCDPPTSLSVDHVAYHTSDCHVPNNAPKSTPPVGENPTMFTLITPYVCK